MNVTASQREEVARLEMSDRMVQLRVATTNQVRRLSIEQALLITESYRQTEGEPRSVRRAHAFAHVLENLSLSIDPRELIVGNRTVSSRAGVVFPEAGISWLQREIESLPTREQDAFEVDPADVPRFREEIVPYWKGATLEDIIDQRLPDQAKNARSVVKINQTDHAQGHIIPDAVSWLSLGPSLLLARNDEHAANSPAERHDFYRSVGISLEAARAFMRRYADLARSLRNIDAANAQHLDEVADRCERLADSPPVSFHDACQSLWFLFVLLQVESNASSFSPGRLDQYLLPYFRRDLDSGRLDLAGAFEIILSLWIKFNQIVYMRSSSSARYFAGFPIGFNVCLGGQDQQGDDATNLLSYLCLRATEVLRLPQPNLSVRLHQNSPQAFLMEATRVIGTGGGMPQVFNDESIIPALHSRGIAAQDARDYAVVGCVELSTQGNNLGWSDAAMFNMVKALELALNDGRCMLTAKQLGPKTGRLADMERFDRFETAFGRQLNHFIPIMIQACDIVDRAHAEILPSPMLSSVIADCLAKGTDVTAGGARYNLSGIQGIQVANVADSMAALRQCVFEQKRVSPDMLVDSLQRDFEGDESLCQMLLSRAPKYGNDEDSVDRFAAKWAHTFAEKLSHYTNARGGAYHAGFYTVSAHVPMGRNVAATPDGRRAQTPLADGGLSPVYGRDRLGPTAVLKSVSKVDSACGSNGTLLNMKFLPSFFATEADRRKFVGLLRALVKLRIHHAQFNVVNKEELVAAMERPEEYRNLTIRVAGYTAYFTELASDLQSEIIERTSFGV